MCLQRYVTELLVCLCFTKELLSKHRGVFFKGPSAKITSRNIDIDSDSDSKIIVGKDTFDEIY